MSVISSSVVPEILAGLADPARYTNRAIDRVAYASDASHYLLTPEAVVTASNTEEVAAIMRGATASGSQVTFRSGGTSLSGQSSTEGILVDTRKGFRRVEVLDSGKRVRSQPGATLRQVNARLLRHGYRLGPDPASEAACTIGGIVANNSSGMACGITENTYRTLESMVFVLPTGTVIDTKDPGANQRLRDAEPELFEGIVRLRRRVLNDQRSVAIIRRQFAMKNSIGYGINAFLDFETPVEILERLIIGSEGTLAFIGEATYRTVPIKPVAATTLALFSSLDDAMRALPELVDTGAATLELMDSTSIRVGQRLADAPPQVRGFEVSNEAALLIEYQAMQQGELDELVTGATGTLETLPLRFPAALSQNAADRALAWKLRKGLYATVAGARPKGTTALLEDIAVPVSSLAATCETLQELFTQFGYVDSVIFGHAKDGNIHFMLTDRFEGEAALGRLSGFTDELVAAVLGAEGNLKAEHGTGRAMAPFVRQQYGDELYEVMREIKRLCDPAGILNPGVIISDEPDIHLRDIKLAEPVEEEVDRCVECGYCEPVCPSKDLTLTPRQRIVVKRGIARAESLGDTALATELERDYSYDGVDTCAVDGMCATVCPVLINTGDLVRRLRMETQDHVSSTGWKVAAKNWGPVTRVGAAALTVADRLPVAPVKAMTSVGRKLLGADTVPEYSADLPRGGKSRARYAGEQGGGTGQPVAVYLPACVNSMFGGGGEGLGVTEAFVRLAERAGVRVIVPEGIESICCGTPWSSKGLAAGHEVMAERVVTLLQHETREGELTIVSDASSCTEGFAHVFEAAGVTQHVEDAVAFVERVVLPRLGEVLPVAESLVLHPTCSSKQMGLNSALESLGAAVAKTVTVPDAWGCCAFAGDRGMLHPELTASATAAEAEEVRGLGAEAHASCNRTCEIGMTRATGQEYLHVIELLEQATRLQT
ncbi:hypothetical protein ACI1US_01343 [Leucobacter sp. BZR 635]